MPSEAQGGEVHEGLEGVVVTRTRLSRVDGDAGELVIAGARVEELAGQLPFEAVVARLWERPFVDFGPMRVEAFSRLVGLGDALDAPEPMDALRASMAHLPDKSTADVVTASIAVFAAAWARRRAGQAPLAPDPHLSHAADVLRMLRGEPAREPLVHGLDTYLSTVVDHGLNASTFAARVIASTGSDLVSAVVGALGALKGPLHGGAPGPVLDMLEAVGTPERSVAWLEGELTAGRRIMGMGHRVYRVRDPRAAVLERAVERLEAVGMQRPRLRLARALERAATEVLARRYPQRSLQANVEFYTAVLLDAVGVPRALFTPTFAVGRVAGWCAHFAEQQRTGRLIRPDSIYVGVLPGERS
jgi:citrate synthase